MTAAGHCGEMLLVASPLFQRMHWKVGAFCFLRSLEGFSSQLSPQLPRMFGMCLELFSVLCLSFPECWRTGCLSLEAHTPPCGLSFSVGIQHGSVAMSIFLGTPLASPEK